MIHRTMQSAGKVDTNEQKHQVLAARQEITGADRRWAGQYESGDIVRYTKGSKAHRIGAGDYARVERVNERENLLTVKRENGESVNYDPRRLHGVTLYRVAERALSRGDRVQFTAPNKDLGVANRQMGTIEKIEGTGKLQLRLDSGRTVAFNIKDNRHLDHGYAMTSHSSQGQTSDRVLIHVDTEQAGERLVNRRLAYEAVSRGRYDAQLYTNDAAKLSEALSRDVSKHVALDVEVNRIHVQGAQFAAKQPSPSHAPQGEQVGRGQAHGQSVGQGGGSQGQS